MKTAKFPVISTTGEEYLVEISDEEYYIESISAIVYEKIYYKTKFLKKDKEKLHRLSNKTCYQYGDIVKYNYYLYNYKQLAIDAVKEYEEWVDKKLESRKLKDKAIKEFKEWDGKC